VLVVLVVAIGDVCINEVPARLINSSRFGLLRFNGPSRPSGTVAVPPPDEAADEAGELDDVELDEVRELLLFVPLFVDES
jgi:hypothetical protein